MSWWHSHPDAAGIVRANWRRAELLLVAHQPPCIRIRDDELANIRRVAFAHDAESLKQWSPRHASWMAAVLVCAEDDLAGLAAVVRAKGFDDGRFHFYLHAGAVVAQLRPWVEEGFPLRHVDTGIRDWRSLHKILGIDFNVQIVADHASERST